jgi:hypothetical protein
MENEGKIKWVLEDYAIYLQLKRNYPVSHNIYFYIFIIGFSRGQILKCWYS